MKFKELQFLFMPHYWIMNNPYNKQVDEYLNELLDRYNFTNIDDYTANLGPAEIWITNHPYSSMTIREVSSSHRPSRLTIQRAYNKLKKDSINSKAQTAITKAINKLREREINE